MLLVKNRQLAHFVYVLSVYSYNIIMNTAIGNAGRCLCQQYLMSRSVRPWLAASMAGSVSLALSRWPYNSYPVCVAYPG